MLSISNVGSNQAASYYSKDGYYVITTQQNYIRKQLLLHRIIALYFIEWYSKTNNVVNHKDGNKLNNKLDK